MGGVCVNWLVAPQFLWGSPNPGTGERVRMWKWGLNVVGPAPEEQCPQERKGHTGKAREGMGG